MKTVSLIFTLLLSAYWAAGVAHADDHMDVNDAMNDIQPEDILVEEESIQMPLSEKVNDIAYPMPKRGMHKNKVKKQFGEPTKMVAPKGKPPISRWVYGDFTVYFESDWVIHSVRNP